ncbi:hypothetical protein P0D75_31195 [Paraburkholderia sediminicola]|uniref:hypothetical protein n=1 Tax=Paraburkholderia sediminicola TaxID=458836 RepID=UPI0038B8C1B3
MNTEAIGGYLELELPREGAEFHRDALRFQSSRAAFLALLRACRPTAVRMPWYICESMVEPVVMAGIPIKRYEIDERLRVKSVTLADGEWLLYVNYFGISGNNVEDVLDRFPRERVVIDNAQAFFAEPRECGANLYSPRKFVGVPDGGYLVTDHPVPAPTEIDRTSQQRFSHLLQRIDADAEAGYAAYTAAEESLKCQEPKGMSKLTQRILAGINYDEVRAKRVANFVYLHEKLGPSNCFPLELNGNNVPLCYPYLGGPADLHAKLIANRIYTPRYWTEIATNESVPPFEAELARTALFLPCDQRLSLTQLDDIARLVLNQRNRS